MLEISIPIRRNGTPIEGFCDRGMSTKPTHSTEKQRPKHPYALKPAGDSDSASEFGQNRRRRFLMSDCIRVVNDPTTGLALASRGMTKSSINVPVRTGEERAPSGYHRSHHSNREAHRAGFHIPSETSRTSSTDCRRYDRFVDRKGLTGRKRPRHRDRQTRWRVGAASAAICVFASESMTTSPRNRGTDSFRTVAFPRFFS